MRVCCLVSCGLENIIGARRPAEGRAATQLSAREGRQRDVQLHNYRREKAGRGTCSYTSMIRTSLLGEEGRNKIIVPLYLFVAWKRTYNGERYITLNIKTGNKYNKYSLSASDTNQSLQSVISHQSPESVVSHLSQSPVT